MQIPANWLKCSVYIPKSKIQWWTHLKCELPCALLYFIAITHFQFQAANNRHLAELYAVLSTESAHCVNVFLASYSVQFCSWWSVSLFRHRCSGNSCIKSKANFNRLLNLDKSVALSFSLVFSSHLNINSIHYLSAPVKQAPWLLRTYFIFRFIWLRRISAPFFMMRAISSINSFVVSTSSFE